MRLLPGRKWQASSPLDGTGHPVTTPNGQQLWYSSERHSTTYEQHSEFLIGFEERHKARA